MKIHRLMAMTFMGPRPDGLEVCHNNGIKDDCRLVNLRYGTHASNIHDIYIHGNENPPRGEVNGCAKLTETQVLEMRKLYSTGQYSHQAIADMFGVSRRHTGGVINKEFWAHV